MQDPLGATQAIIYDPAGRTQRVTTTNNGAYTRYEYGPDFVKSYSTINNLADDSYSAQFLDGAGRVIFSHALHPGSTGGYRAQQTQYDIMGRVVKVSNPTEVNSSRVPTGDDGPGGGGGGGGRQPVNWESAVGVTVDGNSLTATGNGWNTAGAISTQTIASGDGYVEVTASETTKYRLIGLSNGNTDQNYNDIDFAIYLANSGSLLIYEGGVSRGTFGTYATNDVLRVAVEGGVVKYRKNGTLLYTSTVAPTYPLLVDTSLYNYGSTLNNVMISGAGGSSGGWLYTQQTYDWNGRPLRTTNTDGSYKDTSYNGCGCAGGEVVTLTDEVNRQQKIYSDVLGRQWKTEVLNWNGTVYSTVTNTFNSRDQLTNIRQTDNATGAYQDTVMTYDGYGRLATKHVPEQDVGKATAYTYNPDNTISSVTDARGSYATYTYNNRHLVTNIAYTPSAGVTATAPVTFVYDAAGNRTSMSDGLGSKSYSYNQLSQLMSETRTFNDPSNTSINGVIKTLSYDYNLAGELKKITDSTNMTIDYGYDTAGRLNGVTGSGTLYAGVSNYAHNLQYRAWNGLKAMTDGTNHVSSLAYNSRLQPTQFDISGNVVHQNYDYYNDGRISSVHNTTDANFDRGYSYDHLGRLTQATSGGVNAAPYYETFGYDALSNLTSRYTSSWNQDEFWDGATYTNYRREGWGYDADGRNTTIDTRTYTFDASGQTTLMTGQRWVVDHYVATSQSFGYDGDGVKVKEVLSGVATYYLRSSVLGGTIIEELSSSGAKNVGYVYGAAGSLLARQSSSQVTWTHSTPAGTGKYELFTGGGVGRVEFDPLGADVGLFEPLPPDTGGGQGDLGGMHTGGLMDSRYSDMFNVSAGCTIDGMAASCSQAMDLANRDVGVQEPEERILAMMNPLTGQFEPTHFVAMADGWSGFMPYGAIYDGQGNTPWYWPGDRSDDGGPSGPRRVRPEFAPQNSTQVLVPINGVDGLKTLMQNRLDYGDCKDAVNRVIAQLGQNARASNRPDNQPTFGGVMDVLDKIAGAGGIRVNVPPGEYPPGQRVSGGSGYSWREPVRLNKVDVRWDMKTWVYIKGGYSDSPTLTFDRLPYDYGITGIHEMLHQISKYMYTEEELNQAGRDLGGTGVDDYLKKHCSPPQYR